MRIEVPAKMCRGKLREVNESVVAEYRATDDQRRTERRIPVVVLTPRT